MNEEIKQKVCELFDLGEDKWFDYADEFRAFYKQAFNAGLEAAAKMCKSQEDLEYATGKVDHNEMSWCSSNANAIRALKKEDV